MKFAEAIDRFIRSRRPSRADEGYLLKIKDALNGHEGITQSELEDLATELYPGRSPATLNRQLYTPIHTVAQHYGIPVAIKRWKEPKPVNKDVEAEVRDRMIAEADDPDLKALLALMFYTGARVSEAIALTWDDFKDGWVTIAQTKQGTTRRAPVHPKVRDALAGLAFNEGETVLRWRTRSGPRKPLEALCKRLGVEFHPHMARHTFASLLRAAGADLADIQEAGGWQSITSVRRYASPNEGRVQQVVGLL